MSKNLVLCPHCTNAVGLARFIRRATIACPRCKREFDAERTVDQTAEAVYAENQPALKPAASRSPEPEPLLVSPHRCQQCQWSIEAAVGRRKATVTCPRCHQKTSVYAVTFLCDSCQQLLEAPSKHSGTAMSCPNCGGATTVPHDVLHETLPAFADETWFSCECPSCSSELLACKEDVGSYAVCPHCRETLQVPRWGEHLDAMVRGGSDAEHGDKNIRCAGCNLRIPARAETCPLCGTENT